ncbi:GTP-binding protein [bacterium]|nr:GTP-binding protein [bacterium]
MATSAPPPIERIRNFAIVAHIDHGKSTLADRILELTGTVDKRDMRAQFLDRMDIERERGITIKAQAVRVDWEVDEVTYALNMVDTPGHVDFAYEVSRALAACEGVVLLVDSTQGIEAQTVSHAEHAKDLNLAIIPAVNKIDVAGADPVEAALELAAWLDSDPEAVILVSAKTGAGVAALLDAVVAHIPPPTTGGDELRALIFDSEYDNYRGVVAYVRVVDGVLEKGARLQMVGSRAKLEALEVGRFGAKWVPCPALGPGEIGYVVTNLKALDQCRVGDTVAKLRSEAKPLPGYRPARQMVFASLFPVDAADFHKLREGLERLALNDSSVTWEVENNPSFGFGLRAGGVDGLEDRVDLVAIGGCDVCDLHLGPLHASIRRHQPRVARLVVADDG